MARKKRNQTKLILSAVAPPREFLLEQFLAEQERERQEQEARWNANVVREQRHVRLATVLLNMKASFGLTYPQLYDHLQTCSAETLRAVCQRHTYLSDGLFSRTVEQIKVFYARHGYGLEIEKFIIEG